MKEQRTFSEAFYNMNKKEGGSLPFFIKNNHIKYIQMTYQQLLLMKLHVR